jgi:hypothetical protein
MVYNKENIVARKTAHNTRFTLRRLAPPTGYEKLAVGGCLLQLATLCGFSPPHFLRAGNAFAFPFIARKKRRKPIRVKRSKNLRRSAAPRTARRVVPFFYVVICYLKKRLTIRLASSSDSMSSIGLPSVSERHELCIVRFVFTNCPRMNATATTNTTIINNPSIFKTPLRFEFSPNYKLYVQPLRG